MEVTTQLPLRRGRRPRASQSAGPFGTPKGEGEYAEEEPQDDKMSVTWTEGLGQLTMYAFDPEAKEVPVNAHGVRVPEGCLILSDTGVDSQDSGLGNTEAGPREHHAQEPVRQKGEPSKQASRRDPRP